MSANESRCAVTNGPVHRHLLQRRSKAYIEGGVLIVLGLLALSGWSAYGAPGRGVAVVCAAILLAAGVRLLRMGIVVTPAGLLIRNLASTRRVSWESVAEVVPPSEGRLFYSGLGIRLRDGSIIRSHNLAPGSREEPTVCDPYLSRINAALAEASAGPRSSAS